MMDEKKPTVLAEMASILCRQRLESFLRYERLPWVIAQRKASKAAWDALPWHEKLKRRMAAKAHAARLRLAEKIAGRSFDDY